MNTYQQNLYTKYFQWIVTARFLNLKWVDWLPLILSPTYLRITKGSYTKEEGMQLP